MNQVVRRSEELLSIYRDSNGERATEIQQVGSGDALELFYKHLNEIKDHHAKYPNEQAENSELRYRQKGRGDGSEPMPYIIDSMFSGEEAFGKCFDLHANHEEYVNLPNVKHLTYLQYLDVFDNFAPGVGGVKRAEKVTDQYFKYVGELAAYLESFIQRTRPLENLQKVFAEFDKEFDELWEKGEMPNWPKESVSSTKGPGRQLGPEAIWCEDCEKEFKTEGVYRGHLSGRKHIKAAELRAQRLQNGGEGAQTVSLKERAVAEREWRVMRLAKAMNTERADTKVNVERRQTMTQRERQQELEELLSMADRPQPMDTDDDDKEDGEEKIYNPLVSPHTSPCPMPRPPSPLVPSESWLPSLDYFF